MKNSPYLDQPTRSHAEFLKQENDMPRKQTFGKLIANYMDPETGESYTIGQTGFYYGSPFLDVYGRRGVLSVVFIFDGYDNLKARDNKLKASSGEGLNIVPWVALVPSQIIEKDK